MRTFQDLYTAFKDRQVIFYKILPLVLAFGICQFSFANNTTAPKGAYYRYYDSSGIATISRNLSQAHIRHGYEVLDKNMYLVQKVPAYIVEKDLKNESKRAADYKQNQQNEQLRRSYRNVKYASEKKTEALGKIEKQISEQFLRMRKLQADRSNFLTQKSEMILNKKPIPPQLTATLANNEAAIQQSRKIIENLKIQLGQQQQFYDDIIRRLQTME